jgi:hypothetical protein
MWYRLNLFCPPPYQVLQASATSTQCWRCFACPLWTAQCLECSLCFQIFGAYSCCLHLTTGPPCIWPVPNSWILRTCSTLVGCQVQWCQAALLQPTLPLSIICSSWTYYPIANRSLVLVMHTLTYCLTRVHQLPTCFITQWPLPTPSLDLQRLPAKTWCSTIGRTISWLSLGWQGCSTWALKGCIVNGQTPWNVRISSTQRENSMFIVNIQSAILMIIVKTLCLSVQWLFLM